MSTPSSQLQEVRRFSRPQAALAGEPPLTTFWLGLWTCGLSLAWLIPNHYPPWAAFQSDAWTAIMLGLASAAVILRSRAPTQWHASAALVALLACVPWLQYSAGLIPFAGQAWISSAYLFGLLLALLTGQLWEQSCPDQLADGLFVAIGIASVLSVHLQLQTWLGVIGTGILDIWSMGLVGERPYANIGQPNQLSTLLIWGLLACAWGFAKHKVRAPVALLLAAFLLFGIALTQSRTAWLGLTFMLVATWAWRKLWGSKWVPWTVTGLFAYFWSCPLILKWLNRVLLLGSEPSYFRVHFEDETRHLAARLFTQAALDRPWFGYGWSEIGPAQLSMAADFPSLGMTYGHSHNLFLDLILWVGLPLGMLVSVALLRWFWTYARTATTATDAILVMFLGIVGIHAMVELPLHYAYFLLPTGMVMGVLNCRSGGKPMWTTPRWTMIGLWLLAAALLAGLVRDYFRVESSFQSLRFELARIGTLPPGQPPDVVLLTQLRERINFMRYQPKQGMSDDELIWVQQVANAYPGGGVSYKTATALALNGRPQEARQWLRKVCKISKVDECDLIRRVWAQDSRDNPLIAAVSWPD